MSQPDQFRNLPQSDLDLNLMLTDSVWGKSSVPEHLRDKLGQKFLVEKEDGTSEIVVRSQWDLLGFFTRDMRLGNLSNWNNELEATRFNINLANDLLLVGMSEPFIVSLSRSATTLETSQSKGGFLRRIMNTLRHESVNQQLEPPKKQFLGGSSNNNNGRGML